MNEMTNSILVVDDDEDTRSNLADILIDLGYQVDTAPNGTVALELIRKRPYDVALLDLKMPDMDGLTLSRHIRALRSGTVSLIVTAYANEETRLEAAQTGVWRVLSKPVDFSVLLPLVETTAEQPMVMVVDDDRELCDSLWDLFREQGYRVCSTHDVDHAKQRLKERGYQIVLIDLKLPEGDGTEVLSEVRDCNPDAKSILITGFGPEMKHHIDRALQEGANAVCYKPFDIPQLLSTIERLIRNKE